MLELAKFIESLGGGALMISGILGLIYVLYPNLFSPNISVEIILLIGGFIGAGIQGLYNEITKRIAQIPPNQIKEFTQQRELAMEKLKILKAAQNFQYIPPTKAQEIREKIMTELLSPANIEATPFIIPEANRQKYLEGDGIKDLEE